MFDECGQDVHMIGFHRSLHFLPNVTTQMKNEIWYFLKWHLHVARNHYMLNGKITTEFNIIYFEIWIVSTKSTRESGLFCLWNRTRTIPRSLPTAPSPRNPCSNLTSQASLDLGYRGGEVKSQNSETREFSIFFSGNCRILTFKKQCLEFASRFCTLHVIVLP